MRALNRKTSPAGPSTGVAPRQVRLAVRAAVGDLGPAAAVGLQRATMERDRARVEIAKAMARLMSLWMNERVERYRDRLRATFDELAGRQTTLLTLELGEALERPEVAGALRILQATNEKLAEAVRAISLAVDVVTATAKVLKLADKSIDMLERLAAGDLPVAQSRLSAQR